MPDRKTLLKNLIELDIPVSKALSLLHVFGWDCEMPFIELNRSHLIKILNHYLNSQLTDLEVEEWANAIEGREDIHYEQGYSDVISEIISQLANPILHVPLDKTAAHQLLDRLH